MIEILVVLLCLFAPLFLFVSSLVVGDYLVDLREWDKVEYLPDGTIRRAEKRYRR